MILVEKQWRKEALLRPTWQLFFPHLPIDNCWCCAISPESEAPVVYLSLYFYLALDGDQDHNGSCALPGQLLKRESGNWALVKL